MGRIVSLLVLSVFVTSIGCDRAPVPPLDHEIEIAIRAGMGQLSEVEKEGLFKQDHSILLLLAEPSSRRVLELFARLPREQHALLRDKGFLKWRFSDLDPASQGDLLEAIQMRFAIMHGGEVSAGTRQEMIAAFHQSDIGFADVELTSSARHVISFFVLWPGNPPSAFAFINADGVDPVELAAAENRRLVMLRTLGYSKVPVRTARSEESRLRLDALSRF